MKIVVARDRRSGQGVRWPLRPSRRALPAGVLNVVTGGDSDYGLRGTIWTSDVDKGLDIARRVETGSVGVNFYSLDLGAPFGGVKNSGVGRELGPEGLAAYHRLKSIYLPERG